MLIIGCSEPHIVVISSETSIKLQRVAHTILSYVDCIVHYRSRFIQVIGSTPFDANGKILYYIIWVGSN